MLPKIYLFLICSFLTLASFAQAPLGENLYGAILMFPSAPNPTSDKCLIRTYLPDSDPNSSIRILDKDSTMIKEIPLAGQIGIGSTPLNVEDWKPGTYLYQLFYKGEARKTLPFVVKH